ncbi:hypothetical protein AMECASPLE_012401 [Ameca splendens]|uniref:Uncharacterized protein n=1 Tax=Ameca splendens TaxID=208324 RepID=A0ABV0ZM02_9TELE
MNNEAACARYSDFADYRCIVRNVVLKKDLTQRVHQKRLSSNHIEKLLCRSLPEGRWHRHGSSACQKRTVQAEAFSLLAATQLSKKFDF